MHYAYLYLLSSSALGLAFTPLKGEGLHIKDVLYFNMYTGPGFLGALMGVANLLLLAMFFREQKLSSKKREKGGKKMKKVLAGMCVCVCVCVCVQTYLRFYGYVTTRKCWCTSTESNASEHSMLETVMNVIGCKSQQFDRLAAAVSIFLFFSILFIFSVFET